MNVLAFDEINKYVVLRTWLEAMPVSEIMERKNEIWDGVSAWLEYCYALGFKDAREELQQLAVDAIGFLPDDYTKGTEIVIDDGYGNKTAYRRAEPTKTGHKDVFTGWAGAFTHADGTADFDVLEAVYKDIPADFFEKRSESIYKVFNGVDAYERVRAYAEMGDVPSILRVAETDGHRVYNDGGFVAAQGFATVKVWHTMTDERVRDSHSYLEGMRVGLEERFYTFDGDSALYPGDFSDVANNANCRCWITYE